VPRFLLPTRPSLAAVGTSRGVPGLAAIHRFDCRGRALDRPLATVPKYVPFKLVVSAGSSIDPRHIGVGRINWGSCGGRATMVSWILVALFLRLSGAQLAAGRGTRRGVRCWPASSSLASHAFQFFWYGRFAGSGLCNDRSLVHHRCAHSRLDRGGTVGEQHVHERDVWRLQASVSKLLGFSIVAAAQP
jgi:hypothetical protein